MFPFYGKPYHTGTKFSVVTWLLNVNGEMISDESILAQRAISLAMLLVFSLPWIPECSLIFVHVMVSDLVEIKWRMWSKIVKLMLANFFLVNKLRKCCIPSRAACESKKIMAMLSGDNTKTATHIAISFALANDDQVVEVQLRDLSSCEK